jgi:hypothetical protein
MSDVMATTAVLPHFAHNIQEIKNEQYLGDLIKGRCFGTHGKKEWSNLSELGMGVG